MRSLGGEPERARALGTMLGLAVGDALGAPVEFRARDSFPLVVDMMAGGYFRLPAGAWTDDTAMALCLLESLVHDPEFDARDLLDRFLRWMDHGENTSTGRCVGIGQNTLAALGNYRRTGELTAPGSGQRRDGNGALMRTAPVAVLHWSDPTKARAIAAAQSRTTHRSLVSEQACAIMAGMLAGLVSGRPWQQLVDELAAGEAVPALQPILRGDWRTKSRGEIRSTGYVVDTLEAALWSVETTESFEAALIAAVNLGDDSDTVGAVAGQLAGARHGVDAIPPGWLRSLQRLDHVERLFGMIWAGACRR